MGMRSQHFHCCQVSKEEGSESHRVCEQSRRPQRHPQPDRRPHQGAGRPCRSCSSSPCPSPCGRRDIRRSLLIAGCHSQTGDIRLGRSHARDCRSRHRRRSDRSRELPTASDPWPPRRLPSGLACPILPLKIKNVDSSKRTVPALVVVIPARGPAGGDRGFVGRRGVRRRRAKAGLGWGLVLARRVGLRT